MFTDMGDVAVECHMVACVNESLSLYLMSNARFMCERLVAEFPSEVTASMTCRNTLHNLVYSTSRWMHTIDSHTAEHVLCSVGEHLSAGYLLLQIRPGTSSIPLAHG